MSEKAKTQLVAELEGTRTETLRVPGGWLHITSARNPRTGHIVALATSFQPERAE